MLPSTYVKLMELPLTPNRKVDRNALPIPDDANTLNGDKYISPRTEVEKRLSELVAKLLGLERVGADDNFFLIGGQSLFCTQLIARIQNNFEVELPMRSIIESPTPAQLARQIENAMAARICPMTADEVEDAFKQASSGGGQP